MVVDEAVAYIQHQGAEAVRSLLVGDQAIGPEHLASPEDPGLFGPSSVAWRIHGDASMIPGGVRSLLLQALHPLAMAGVAEHSRYEDDPLGRLSRTGRFIAATTFGNTSTAEHAIAMVRRIHTRVHGTAPDGRAYSANDPELLRWVHVAEVDSFLTAYERYGASQLTDAEKDQYVAEMAEVGRRLGADEVPETVAELKASLDGFRSDCTYGRQARKAARFLIAPPLPLAARGLYGIVFASGVTMLPGWARCMMWIVIPPGVDTLAIRPAATALTRSLGWFLEDGSAERYEQFVDD